AKRYEKDLIVMAAIVAARLNLSSARTSLGVSSAPTLSRNVPDAQWILERTEGILLNLDLQIGAYRSSGGPAQDASIALTERVRGSYLAAVALLLKGGAVSAFESAERMAAQLPRALAEVDLARLEGRPATTAALEGSRKAIAMWVGRIRTQMDAYET